MITTGFPIWEVGVLLRRVVFGVVAAR